MEYPNIQYAFWSMNLKTLLEKGSFASAAHTVRYCLKQGIFHDISEWRTAALLFMDIEEIMKIGEKPKGNTKHKERLSKSVYFTREEQSQLDKILQGENFNRWVRSLVVKRAKELGLDFADNLPTAGGNRK